jgi:CheY-like chemotaxis protein
MPPTPFHHASRPVLIIDDVASEARTLDLVCRSLGVETLCTTSAAEAGVILARTRPAAIITDLVMPGADGLDCLCMIAEHAPGVPVMVVTGSDELLHKAAGEFGQSYGLDDLVCVAKPVDINTLRAFVGRAGLPFTPSQWDLH